MFNKKTKKGFTIVELVIVIAVIAILAAVLIPTFTGLIKKAKISSDQTLVRNLNTSLAISSEGEGTKKLTMYETLEEMKEQGYVVDKLTPTHSKNNIVWDSENNQFVLVYENGDTYTGTTVDPTADKSKMWKIYTEIPTESEYSVYLAGTNATGNVEVKGVGFDAGENTGISTVSYKNETSVAKDVVIRTNGGTLNVNAPLDTVRHYGDGNGLNITSVASSSYHEFGYFPKATIAQGRIIVEEKGNIPSVEISAVPTLEKPVKVETNKDIVISTSKEVVDALGNNALENVEIKVASFQAKVVIDEKINKNDVVINGQIATTNQIVSIKKVKTLEELLDAIKKQEKYIMFLNDIETNGTDLINLTYSVTLDGNGFKLTGNGGNRQGFQQMICFGFEATQLIEKISVKNLTIETTTVTRALECRGNTKEIIFDNVTLNSSGPSNDQGFTFGGNYSDLMKLTIKNSNFTVGGDGYAFLFFNAVDMVVENSIITGWAGLYFKSPNNSHGARDSKVYISNTNFICHNENWGSSNSFGAIVFEDGNIDVTLVDTNLDVTTKSDQQQCAILFSAEWASYYGTELKNGHVVIKGNSSINGKINNAEDSYDLTNDISIESGIFTFDPTEYVSAGHTVSKNGSLYIVK